MGVRVKGNPLPGSHAVCSALPNQVQFMYNRCIVLWMGSVRLTRKSFVVSSGPVMWMDLQVSLSYLPRYHNDLGSHLWLRYFQDDFIGLSSQ